ncbi:HpcH/HpaI aldolase family protein [Paenibacillus mendelii]|uniref:HpcH/HpaI aldolase/citrate lyase family protein n=1 Tax=Paenibacillus mendelii TaxID=206163 RepID=A0ABV6JLC9_9BACL|nr:aldolase/citrate lyase family protein [Paenibacillus mendelii]MCQ6562275.1 aldolase/citrate lyase family protein [Paenibacillus mendelii]
MRPNVFKKRLSDTSQVGTFVKIDSAETIELLGYAGFDFIVIDMEHTTLDFGQVERMVRVADLHGMSSIIRVPDASRMSILRALDLGAAGVQVPQVYTAGEVRDVVDKAKYPPQGSRGLTYAHRAAGFGHTPGTYVEDQNEASTIIVHVETVNAYEHIAELCAVEGLDAVFIGPLDLSVCLGVTGADYIEGELAAPVRSILDACRQAGKMPGIAVTNAAQYKFALQQRIPYIVWSSDVAFFKQSLDAIIQTKSNVELEYTGES